MIPDLNQIRRDLGQLDKQSRTPTLTRPPMTHQAFETEFAMAQAPDQQEGVVLNALGWWLLAICATGLLVWIFIDPIVMFLMFLFKIVIWGAVIGFIGWIFFGSKN